MAVIKAPPLFEILSKLIDLPPHVTALDLRMRVDEVPTLTITYLAELKAPLEPITKRFRLEEIEPTL